MQDDLDQLIDGALATYANPEPLAGFEQRVVARARAAQSRRRWWPWAVAIPAAAIVLLVLMDRTPPVPAMLPPVVANIPPAPPTVAAKAVVRHTRRRAAVVAPKRPTFPTITPMTDQERLLVQLAQSHPEQLLVQPPDVLEVKPIEIAPLDNDGRQ